MHALLFRVTINDREQAEKFLKEELVPGISQAPGFVAGYWCNVGGDQGRSIVVFESEDAAKAVMEQGPRPPEDRVRIDNIDLAEVVAHA